MREGLNLDPSRWTSSHTDQGKTWKDVLDGRWKVEMGVNQRHWFVRDLQTGQLVKNPSTGQGVSFRSGGFLIGASASSLRRKLQRYVDCGWVKR